jgi:hypothetical protein
LQQVKAEAALSAAFAPVANGTPEEKQEMKTRRLSRLESELVSPQELILLTIPPLFPYTSLFPSLFFSFYQSNFLLLGNA